MSVWTIILVAYIACALVAYLRYNYGNGTGKRKPPRSFIRWATPWYYQPFGTWFLGYWDHRRWKGYPQWGFRILGFEYWVEYWK